MVWRYLAAHKRAHLRFSGGKAWQTICNINEEFSRPIFFCPIQALSTVSGASWHAAHYHPLILCSARRHVEQVPRRESDCRTHCCCTHAGNIHVAYSRPFLGPFLRPCVGRRNEHVRMNLLGMFPFTAPYLPWVLLLLSAVLGSPLESDLVRAFRLLPTRRHVLREAITAVLW